MHGYRRIIDATMAPARTRWHAAVHPQRRSCIMRTHEPSRAVAFGAVLLCMFAAAAARDVPFIPTPEPVVDKMLELARLGPQDVVYDLGSGDGRIVITAAKRYGVRGVGIDIDPDRILEARQNARNAGVADRVEFRQGDLFKADIRDATVVTLYLLTSVNRQLRPKLLAELRPGTRIVSHAFDMGDWKPATTAYVGASTVHYWIVPEPSR
jgi:SAM-dependent methyltransferase